MCPRQGSDKEHSSRIPEEQQKLSAINDQFLIRREGPLVTPKQRIDFSVKLIEGQSSSKVLKTAFSFKPDLSCAVGVP